MSRNTNRFDASLTRFEAASHRCGRYRLSGFGEPPSGFGEIFGEQTVSIRGIFAENRERCGIPVPK